jgi:acyl-CoA synthetase (AMP-forming)/AMP-acid ligase II
MNVPMLVSDFLRRAVSLYGKKEAVVDGPRRFTYQEFAVRCYQLGHALRAAGLKKSDRVGIVSPNTHYFLEAFYGAASIGVVLVPLNYRLVSEDFWYCLDHAGARVVLADAELCESIDAIRERLPGVEHFVAPGSQREGWLNWDSWIAQQPETEPTPADLVEDDLVSINYTSGTTARPKGVMLTHRNFYTNAYHYIAHFGITHDDVNLWTLPMFHCNGWGGVYALTAMGAKHVVIRSPEAEAILQAVQDEGVTFACMAPIVMARVLDFPGKQRFQLNTNPRICVAGAPPPVSHVERLEQGLGWVFIQLYGLTETSPILTISDIRPHLNSEGKERYRLKARAGHAALGVELRVLDQNGEQVIADDRAIGQVAARGNMIFKGYWQQPEETARVMRDGFFLTGDMATVDETGSINIVDRAKDVIISGGENISSIQVQDHIYGHPAVLEAAVVGAPDEKWGETPVAVVVLRTPGSVTSEELRDFCRERMAHFMVPSRFDFVEALPRTATGKLKKFEIREKYWAGHERRVQ